MEQLKDYQINIGIRLTPEKARNLQRDIELTIETYTIDYNLSIAEVKE